MKKLFWTLCVVFGLSFLSWNNQAFAEDKQPETKKVCLDQKDAKSGKTKQVCKEVKVHKKLEGTKVPEKKK